MGRKEHYKIRFLKRKVKEAQKEGDVERLNMLESKLYNLKIKGKRSINSGKSASNTPVILKTKAKIIYTPMGGKPK